MAFRVGTRKSLLAVTQTQILVDLWERNGVACEVVPMAVRADGSPAASLASDTPGQFTDALEEALRDGRIDAAVHSLKDLPTRLAADVVVAAVSTRADCRDCIVGVRSGDPATWPPGTRLATSSLRRKALLENRWPHLTVVPVRGNLDTRWQRLLEHGWEGLVLAVAGAERLGWSDRITHRFSTAQMVPAPGQGALAVEVRAGDAEARRIAGLVHDETTRMATEAERAVLAAVGSNCQIPLGAVAEPDGDRWSLTVWLARADGLDPCALSWAGPDLSVGVSWVLDELKAAGVPAGARS